MALEGTYIINNPFWWSADDKFFNFSLAAKIGVAIPKTVLLPQQSYIPDITSESLKNLEFPLDWEGIVNYVGFPAFLKPFDGGGWKNVSKIHSLEQLWYEYNQTGTLCMTLQEGIEWDQFVRCYCVGKEKVLIMPYDPSKPYLSGMQYVNVDDYLSPELHARVERDVITICTALGYDLNTVEFAIKDGVPYAIDFMNPAPDAELASVGERNHHWIVSEMTDFILRKLKEGFETPEFRWSAMFNPAESNAPNVSEDASNVSDSTSIHLSSAQEVSNEEQIELAIGDLPLTKTPKSGGKKKADAGEKKSRSKKATGATE
jgi:hypothetical protein